MSEDVFSILLGDTEARQRAGRVTGLRYAEVAEITEEGYLLDWLSGPVRSRSAPARVARFMAGSERGAYFPLEIGDEVVVGFEEGNLDRPVILGALWSDQDPVPTNVDTSSSNNIRSIVSRAKAEITFDDTSGATRLLIQSAGGMQLLFDDARQTLTLQVNDSTRIELSPAGIKLQGARIDLN